MSEAVQAGETQPEIVEPVAVTGGRITSLDFIRGIAVMGILAANIVAFGQPFSAYMWPEAFLTPHPDTHDLMWVAQFVLIDGKMRALFTLLFGAGLYLFMEKAWERGRGRKLQVRRLLGLGLFGLIHFFFIWTGDILFLYSVAGMAALLFIKMKARNQLILGLIGYFVGGLLYLAVGWSMQTAAEGGFGGDTAQAVEMREEMQAGKSEDLEDSLEDAAAIKAGNYAGFVAHNFQDNSFELLFVLLLFWFETLPLMLMGMALYRLGLFDGRMARGKQIGWGALAILVGGLLSFWIAWQTYLDGLSYYGTLAAFMGWSHFPRAIMGVGLLAVLAVVGMQASGWLATRIAAAGRAAFTNYLGTSILMLFVFHGWAGGLFGKLDRIELYMVTAATWIVMLAWSKPWLDRFRYGPLEWLWRCLTYGKWFAIRR